MMTVIYIFSAYMNIYKGMTYCIKTQKGKKMAAVCLWLIENKSIQMLRSVLCHLCKCFQVRCQLQNYVSTTDIKFIYGTRCCPRLGAKGTTAQYKQKKNRANITKKHNSEYRKTHKNHRPPPSRQLTPVELVYIYICSIFMQ